VDHEIKYDVDVQRSGRKDGEAMSLEEHGAAELRLNRKNRWIEPFKVTGLENALVLVGDREQFICLCGSGGERLFDKQIESGLKQDRCDGMVLQGGNGNGSGVEIEVGCEELLDGGEDRDGVFGPGFRGACGIGLNCGDKSDTLVG
jgi:hypothetical protein